MSEMIGPASDRGVSAVTLDLYNTLLISDGTVDHAAKSAQVVATSLRNDGIEMSEDVAAGLFSTRIDKSADDGLTYFERRISTFLNSIGVEVPTSSITHYATDILSSWDSRWELADDAIQVILTLKLHGIAVGLVTNFDHYPHIRGLVEKLNLKSLMDAIIVSSEVGSDKPDSRIFEYALSALNTPAERAVHVGDDEVDVVGAQRAGMRAVRIDHSRSYDRSDVSEDAPTINSLPELLPLIIS